VKAQSLRRTFWLTSGLLTLGLAGAVAWVLLQVRPAQTEPLKDVNKWLEVQFKKYRSESIVPQAYYPVEEDDLDQIVQEKKHGNEGKGLPKIDGKKVGAFVGPVPPEPQPDKPAAAVDTGPKGLAEVGQPTMVTWRPPPFTTVFTWEFPDKKHDTFNVGDVVPEGGKFRVVDVIPLLEDGRTKYRFVYEAVGAGGADAPAPKRDEHVFDMTPKRAATGFAAVDVKGNPIAPPVPAKPPTAGPVATEPSAVPVAVASGEPRVSSERPAPNVQNFWFEDAPSYARYSKDSVERMLESVKTETAVDDAGRPRGIKITAPGMGSDFDVKAGDIVISVNGRPVHSRNEVIEIVKKIPKDTAIVPVVVERNGRQLTYNVDPRDPEVRRAAGRVRFK
jgi:hypothetical protein